MHGRYKKRKKEYAACVRKIFGAEEASGGLRPVEMNELEIWWI